jgi:peptidyl-prolyl cis-trans isomerase C
MPSIKPATLLLVLFALLITACGGEETPPPTAASTPSVLPSDTPAIPPTITPTPEPTATPVPLAVLVNGEPITLAEYQAELARYQASMAESGTDLAADAGQVVLEDLINLTLLAQGARAQGFVVDDTALQVRIDSLVQELGSQQALSDWMAANQYSEADFRQALRRAAEAAWMRDKIAAGIPETTEQVHARQILLYNSEDANQVYSQLQSGQDFADLAADYDPVAEGELGWFPRGYLTQPAVEEAAFSLEPGQYSTVIDTTLGYHILQVIEKDAEHSLSPDARLVLQLQAIKDWLQTQRSQSTIETLLP